MKITKQLIFNLNAEEQALSDAFGHGEFKSVKNIKAEKKKLQAAATNYLKKEAKINIRLSISELA